MTTLLAPPDSGTFSGYLASFSPDHEGDTIMGAAAVADSVAAVNAGRMVWHLTDSHSEKASDVVATVTHAAVDGNGVRVEARWAPTAAAQSLRQMVRSGHELGMSIDYRPESWRPDRNTGGRFLDRITIHGGAIVTHPMNSACRITEGKSAVTAPIVNVFTDARIDAERRDPDRDRIRRMADLIEAKGWPPAAVVAQIGVKAAYAMVESTASAEAARRRLEDDADRLARERFEENNAYSSKLAAWMAANR